MTVATSTGWDAYDARLIGSLTLDGELVSTAYPQGAVQFRVDLAPRSARIVALAVLALAMAVVSPFAGAFVAVLVVADLCRGWWRVRPWTARVIRDLVR